MHFGYTMLCEQTAPKQLVSDVTRSEEIGFDFSVISDHYAPWLEDHGQSPMPVSLAVLPTLRKMGERRAPRAKGIAKAPSEPGLQHRSA